MVIDLTKRALAFLWQFLKAIQVFVFGLISLVLVIALLASGLGGSDIDIPDGGALVLNPVGGLVEQKAALDPQTLLRSGDVPRQTLVKDILDALALAKNDERIQFLVLNFDNMGSSYISKLQRVAAAIDDFKSSGKKVIATGSQYSQSALFLAAHADEVLMNPEGVALPEGYGMYRTYYKTILENYDVSINIFKVGKYKSALEPYFRNDMSDEDKTARLGILNNWWSAYTNDFEMSRALPAGTIDQKLADTGNELKKYGGNLGVLSVENRFVDRLITDFDLRTYLRELTGEDQESGEYRAIGFEDYLASERKPEAVKGKKIAVITAVGSIVDGYAGAGTIGSLSLNKLIRKASKNEDVVAIVLRVDSGGGSKSASENIRSELEGVQASGTPVVASMGSLAASGGYWISASADEIWASPTTVTGSIGIFGFIPTIEKTLARYGVYSDGVATTPITGGASIERGVTPLYAKLIQAVIDSGYQQFLETVAKGRNMSVDDVHEIAQGRIWSGERALELGLVDSLGDLEQAIESAAKLAAVDDYSTWYVEPEITTQQKVMQLLTSEIAGSEMMKKTDPISMIYRKVEKEAGFLTDLNDPHHAYVICTSCLLEP
ncbi:MAG: protease-4 [Candidatus Azotimanducaceae bacterium]|jgi:protease-4